MKTNKKGLELIKNFEGLRLKSYLCPAGVWTIGYGHTGPDVKPNMTITKEKAEELLIKDLEKFEKGVLNMLKVPVNENEFSALVSLAFNIGLGSPNDKNRRGLYWSSVIRELNNNNRQKAADAFLNFTKARDPKTGQLVELAGLKRRREAERKLFLEPAVKEEKDVSNK